MSDLRIYIKHDAPAYIDPNIQDMIASYGWAGYGWFWYLVERMRLEADYKLPYSDRRFKVLAKDMEIPVNEVKEYIDYCIAVELFHLDGVCFWSDRLLRDMAKLDGIRASCSEASKSRWKADAKQTDKQTHTESNAKISKDKVSKDKVSLEQWFESVRPDYPLFTGNLLDVELKRCQEWHADHKSKITDWKRAFRNWMARATPPKPTEANKPWRAHG